MTERLPSAERAGVEHSELVSSDITRDDLIAILKGADVPIDTFGQGAAKTIEHLLKEIQEGESTLRVWPTGEILRELQVLWVDVVSEHANGDVYFLCEDRQEFKDGREDNIKRRKLEASLGEKLKPGEKPDEAVVRALEEEIGVNELTGVFQTGYSENALTPDTYPGVPSSYKFHKYVVTIDESEFAPEGYIEDQPDKTNYYVWDKYQAE
jgi:hypothetical protein